MDVSPTSTAATGGAKTPEAESDTPSLVQTNKPLTFSNGVLKRHHTLHHHLNSPPPPAVTYKECMKNHAAAMGGHAVDGCGEFMPSPDATASVPTSLKCAACGCHRNFHRREPEDPLPLSLPPPPPRTTSSTHHVIEYQPHHRHHPPPPPHAGGGSPSSPSPPPISSTYYPSAPHMLLALSSGGLSAHPQGNNPSIANPITSGANSSGRKRFRTKFTQYQKERMHEFAEKIGWKVQKRDEDMISEFCREVGVDRGVLKVWMHNNKNTFGKKDSNSNTNGFGVRNSLDNITTQNHHHIDGGDNDSGNPSLHHNHQRDDSLNEHVVAANGSSSSS